MATKKKSHKGKGYYVTYAAQNQAEKNRIAKLKRHLKGHPEDVQAQKAMKHVGTRRAKPRHKGNFPKAKQFILDKAGNRIPMPRFAPDWDL